MDTYSKQRFTFWVIVALAIMNVGTLGTIWFMQSNNVNVEHRQSSKKHDKHHHRTSKHIAKELGLTAEQAKQFEAEKNTHFERMDVFSGQKKVLKKALFQALRANDEAKIEAVKADLIALEQEKEIAFIKHLQAYQVFLNAEQQDKLFKFFEKRFGKKKRRKKRH